MAANGGRVRSLLEFQGTLRRATAPWPTGTPRGPFRPLGRLPTAMHVTSAGRRRSRPMRPFRMRGTPLWEHVSGVFSAFSTCPSDRRETPDLSSHPCEIPARCPTRGEDLGRHRRRPLFVGIFRTRGSGRGGRRKLFISSVVRGAWGLRCP